MANINELVRDITKDFLDENSLMLWNTEYVKEGRDFFLRIYVDRTDDEYVSTDDCEKLSTFLSEKLDELDPIEENYYLEVSSPGMDRELICPDHFEMCIGEMVEVVLKDFYLIEEYDLKLKEFTAQLKDFEDDTVILSTEIDTKAKNRKPGAKVSPKAIVTRELSIKLSGISKINLAVIFE